MIAKLVHRAWNNPWLLLSLCILFWASNVIAARLAPGEISPVLLANMRWIIASAIMAPLTWGALVESRKAISAHWLYFLLAAGCGFTLYSLLFFAAGKLTTGVNIAMLCSVVPVFAIVFAWIFLRMKAGPVILISLVLAVAGALVVATRGDVSVLAQLAFNAGDIMMICASMLHAGYTVSLRNRPPLAPLVFFAVMCIVGFVTSAPFLAAEIISGNSFMPSWKGVALALYVGIFPSMLAQMFYMRGVELIGPQRTALFYNFVPVAGALMAVAVLGEPFAWYHALGFVLVLSAVVLAERWRSSQA